MDNKTFKLKDYYNILGVSSEENNQETIRNSYKALSQKLHPDNYVANDCIERMIDLNEAFLVLSDKDLKAKYDIYLTDIFSYESLKSDDSFFNDISDKRLKAEKFVNNFFDSYNGLKRKNRNSSLWWGCAIIFIVLSFIGQCTMQMYRQRLSKINIEKREIYTASLSHKLPHYFLKLNHNLK